jgi:hypothetical protein
MHENSQTWIYKGLAEVRKYPSDKKKKQGEVLRRFKSEDTANKWARYRSDNFKQMKKIYNKSLLTNG